ncbi:MULTISPECIES: hypothetical protein [unclassified Frankia]|uniref:hypothetical protein n=1 Tax=unclassified Frankia TaxID=2632575 RepID=UPI002024D649
MDVESRRLEAEQHWSAIEEAYARIQREDPAGWQGYLDEPGSWESGTSGTDEPASLEWPEFNR